jgi:4-alpha-glucanotransferase
MGWDASDEQAARASLDQLEEKSWLSVLPPVVVAYAGRGPVEIPIVLPDDAMTVRWTVSIEGGGEVSGEAEFARLAMQDWRTLGDRTQERRTLRLENELPWGYHHLRLEGVDGPMLLIVTPGTCWLPDGSDGRRFWGLAAQLYLLRSAHNWGIGDFTDLRELVDLASSKGADAIGLNPLHAMFLDRPRQASPYSPSDRVLLNVLNIDVEAVPEFAHSGSAQKLVSSANFRKQLDECRNAALVDYDNVARLKLSVLRLLFATFEERNDPGRKEGFHAFHQERSALLDRACLFQSLRDYFSSQDSARSDCKAWPEDFRNSNSPAMAEFQRMHAELIRFHLWLQWVADTQLAAAADAAKQMVIGLYRDLAVGAHGEGAEVWSHPESLVSGATIGAPPDIWNPAGQNWGLPPLHPQTAREHGYSSFIELIQANMRHAGGLRVDHAMALKRVYWIPKGGSPKDGAYIHYPTDDLVGILALESHRNRCLVVGEDLGTVPEGFRERMAEANILSYRVLFFERDEDGFLPPEKYPKLAVCVASSHDLPTLRGWWEEADIDTKQKLHLFPEGPEEARRQRKEDRRDLLEALRREGILPRNGNPDAEQFCEAAHRFLARSRSMLTLVQLDDITEERDQVNVPGTSGGHPNWSRRLSATLEELAIDPRLDRATSAFRTSVSLA